MRSLRRGKKLALGAAAAALLLVATPGQTVTEEEAALAGRKAIDKLYYGEILFHLYQQKHFFALTDLIVAGRHHPLVYQGDEPDLLLAGLAVSYGLYDLAEQRLEPLLSGERPQKTRDIAWFYRAKLSFLKGDLAGAEHALKQIRDTLPEDRNNERYNLLVDVLRAQGKFKDAIEVLDEFDDDSPWRYYAFYNTGVSLIRFGKLEEGSDLLEEVAELESEDEELKSLADRANLALGYAWFAKDRGGPAVRYFSRVRLQGPFSNQALLGLGWAYTTNKDYQKALVPWFELKKRHAIDPSVQESLITIPHVIERIGKPELAISHYEKAIATLEMALTRLDNVILRVRSGEFLRALRPQVVDDESDARWELDELPDSDAAPYITQLLTSDAFQQAFEDFRTLLYLDYVLKRWEERLPTFMTAVETRERAYRETSQRIAQLGLDARAARINRAWQALGERFDAIAAQETARAMELASVEEAQVLARLAGLEQRVRALQPATPEAQALLDRIRVLRGQIRWNVMRDFAPRLWAARLQQQELAQQLAELNRVQSEINGVQATATGTFSGFRPRFQALETRLRGLSPRLAGAISRQEARLQALAVAELNRRRNILQQQIARARFSMVRLYDQLYRPGGGPRPAPAEPAPASQEPGATAPAEAAPEAAPDAATPVEEPAVPGGG